jgi:hypothetical protein
VIEDMDQTSLTSSAPTSVIVNVTGMYVCTTLYKG